MMIIIGFDGGSDSESSPAVATTDRMARCFNLDKVPMTSKSQKPSEDKKKTTGFRSFHIIWQMFGYEQLIRSFQII